MGRKAISDVPKTDTPLRIRLTEAERSALDESAALSGMTTSAWAREALLALAASKLEVAKAPRRRKPPEDDGLGPTNR